MTKWRFLLSLLPVLFLTACRTAQVRLDTAAPYQAELARLQSVKSVQPGSDEERQAIERVKGFFATMTADSVREGTSKVYAPDAYLNDTLTTLRGSARIESYFLETVKQSESVTVVFEDVARSGDNYYFRWVMDTRLKKLRKGKTIRTIGITHMRFDGQGRVVLHQDFWDSASGLYEHVPGLGGMMRWVRAKIEATP
ncbi:MAG TPA: nuclear transport factor 2 family protein [Roseimicrobium sp.]|nr:nuclear transport factor 2 family protein [Roseimicrobium sp.]